MTTNCCEQCYTYPDEFSDKTCLDAQCSCHKKPCKTDCKWECYTSDTVHDCDCHNVLRAPQQAEWEKEFAVFHKDNEWRPDASPLDVKHFIQSLLTEQRELLADKIGELKYKGEPSEESSDTTWAAHFRHNRNIADIISKIRDL